MELIETERLVVRRFYEYDWMDMHEYLSDPKVLEYEPYSPLSADDCKIECSRRVESDKFYAVCLKDTNKMIGNIYISQCDEKFNSWEIGYVFNSNFHGKGYATEGTLAMINYMFCKKRARRIIAMCDPLNTPSWKLLERVGMQREAHFRKKCYFKYDQNNKPIWKDTYVYAILEEEFSYTDAIQNQFSK